MRAIIDVEEFTEAVDGLLELSVITGILSAVVGPGDKRERLTGEANGLRKAYRVLGALDVEPIPDTPPITGDGSFARWADAMDTIIRAAEDFCFTLGERSQNLAGTTVAERIRLWERCCAIRDAVREVRQQQTDPEREPETAADYHALGRRTLDEELAGE